MKKWILRKIITSSIYIALYILFFIVTIAFANIGWGTNTQGDSCDPYLLNGSETIGNVTTNIYFQGMWDELPCRWTSEYYFVFYTWTLIFYWIYKKIGKKVLRKPVPLAINITEFISAWGIYLCGLLMAVSKQHIFITFSVFYNAFIGTFLLLAPMLMVILLMWLSNIISFRNPHQMGR